MEKWKNKPFIHYKLMNESQLDFPIFNFIHSVGFKIRIGTTLLIWPLSFNLGTYYLSTKILT